MEVLEPGTGFVILGRFVYPERDKRNHAQQADRYDLAQGEGIIFVGEEDNPAEPIFFKQSEFTGALQQIGERTVQLIALVELSSGGLLMTDLHGTRT